MFLYLNSCLNVMLNSFSYSFTFISFISDWLSEFVFRTVWIELVKHFPVYTISYRVYNCPNTIVHCVMNLSWFCNQTSYLMFSILGQWIYHDFESIQACSSSFSFPWDMEFVMVLNLYKHVAHLSVFHGIENLSWFWIHTSM